jgi:hypothetical protein
MTLKKELEETLTNYIEKASNTFEHVATYVRNIRNLQCFDPDCTLGHKSQDSSKE